MITGFKLAKICYMGIEHDSLEIPFGHYAIAIAVISIHLPYSKSFLSNIPMCSIHLDNWLDSADDNPVLEPIEVEWISYGEG